MGDLINGKFPSVSTSFEHTAQLLGNKLLILLLGLTEWGHLRCVEM